LVPVKRRPGVDTSSAGALMISVPYDSTGLVPDLANGGSQATQAACGLAILRDLSKNPPTRPVVLFFTGADGMARRRGGSASIGEG